VDRLGLLHDEAAAVHHDATDQQRKIAGH
jgi:hypothetical protein